MNTEMNLAQRINQAATAVGALKPDKTNTFQNYQYISSDKILERCGNALASAGVLVLPSIVGKGVETSTGGNKARYDATVDFAFLVTDGVTEYRVLWVGMGVATDSPDKAIYKAITSGHRYFLAKLLNVGVGNEDSEHEPVEPVVSQMEKDVDIWNTRPDVNAPASAPATADEIAILSEWNSPVTAKAWAVAEGACLSDIEASNSFKKIVDGHGGRLTKENIAIVYLEFLRRQNEKLSDLKQPVAA